MEHSNQPLGLALSEGLGPNAQAWTCFHCGEVCADAEAARLHFGASEHQQAGCQIDLAEYRRMEEVNRRHCEEDTELHRTLHRMECEHRRALVNAEEEGYAKGVADTREELARVRQALPDALRHSTPSAGVATMTAGMEHDHAVMRRLVAGVDHLDKLTREWEPDHSSGADRRGWLLAKDARDEAMRLLGPNVI